MKKSGSRINLDIHHSKVFSSEPLKYCLKLFNFEISKTNNEWNLAVSFKTIVQYGLMKMKKKSITFFIRSLNKIEKVFFVFFFIFFIISRAGNF